MIENKSGKILFELADVGNRQKYIGLLNEYIVNIVNRNTQRNCMRIINNMRIVNCMRGCNCKLYVNNRLYLENGNDVDKDMNGGKETCSKGGIYLCPA